MDRVQRLEHDLKSKFPEARVLVDRPERGIGPIFVEVAIGAVGFVINFQTIDPRYGLSSLPGELFGGADEVYDSIDGVLNRMIHLIAAGERTQPPA